MPTYAKFKEEILITCKNGYGINASSTTSSKTLTCGAAETFGMLPECKGKIY